jgi:membrane fusion protein, type I secretion system
LLQSSDTDWKQPITIGFAVIVASFGLFGAWSAFARLDAAAVAPGVVTVETNRKTVQHLEGGIVSALNVRDGDRVNQGDLLVRLDPTRADASAELYRRQLAAALVAESRLVAERDSRDYLEFPREVLALKGDPLVAEAIADQLRQFQARRDTLARQVEVMEAQMQQIRKEIEAIEANRKIADAQKVFILRDLVGLRDLWEKKLVELTKLSVTEREHLRLEGVIAQAGIDVARAEQRIREIELKIEQLRQERREDASKQLPDVRRQMGDLRQQIIVAEDMLRRVEIRAPVSGTVQQLRIFTLGGVLRAGDPILDIVPDSEELIVRARVSPLDVHTVRAGMAAEVRFPAFHRPNVPFFMGTVRTVSSDRLTDAESKEPYFAAEISVNRSTIPEDLRDQLSAGLATDVIIATGERSALAYLLSPITQRMYKAMRER